jgi:hypothetical protein
MGAHAPDVTAEVVRALLADQFPAEHAGSITVIGEGGDYQSFVIDERALHGSESRAHQPWRAPGRRV